MDVMAFVVCGRCDEENKKGGGGGFYPSGWDSWFGLGSSRTKSIMRRALQRRREVSAKKMRAMASTETEIGAPSGGRTLAD